MAIFRLGDKTPTIDPSVYIAETASVIGDVTIGAGSSVWASAVIRADNDSITIGAGTNIQDGAVLHADPGEPLVIGSNVTVGHQAMLHGCTVEDGALIGIQAVVLNQALIRKNSLVGACAPSPWPPPPRTRSLAHYDSDERAAHFAWAREGSALRLGHDAVWP